MANFIYRSEQGGNVFHLQYPPGDKNSPRLVGNLLRSGQMFLSDIITKQAEHILQQWSFDRCSVNHLAALFDYPADLDKSLFKFTWSEMLKDAHRQDRIEVVTPIWF